MRCAPLLPSSSAVSSQGWNRNLTRPGSFSFDNNKAAPSAIAVCESCPQACMAPGICEAYSYSFCSRMGSASMSARMATTLPPSPISATTPVFPTPRLTLYPIFSNSSATIFDVRCSSKPISGCMWKSRRHSISSSEIACDCLSMFLLLFRHCDLREAIYITVLKIVYFFLTISASAAAIILSNSFSCWGSSGGMTCSFNIRSASSMA